MVAWRTSLRLLCRIEQEVDGADRIGDTTCPRAAVAAQQGRWPLSTQGRRQFARHRRILVGQMRAADGLDESDDLFEPGFDDLRNGVVARHGRRTKRVTISRSRRAEMG